MAINGRIAANLLGGMQERSESEIARVFHPALRWTIHELRWQRRTLLSLVTHASVVTVHYACDRITGEDFVKLSRYPFRADLKIMALSLSVASSDP